MVSNLLNIRFGKFFGVFVRWWNVEADGRYKRLNTGTVTHSPPRPPTVVQQRTLLTLRKAHLHMHSTAMSLHTFFLTIILMLGMVEVGTG